MEPEPQTVATDQTPQPVVGGSHHTGGARKIAGLLIVLVAIGLLAWAWHVHTTKQSVVKPLAAQSQRRDVRPGDRDIKVNQAVIIDNLKLTIASTGLVTATSEASEASTEGTLNYAVANIKLEGAGAKAANYAFGEFSLLTDKETSAALGATSLPMGSGIPLGSGSLKKGDKADGQIAFLLPKTYKYYYIVFTPLGGSHERLILMP